ncbi:hypothetical protein [Rhodococcus sp. ACPA1]|uniref:hypothetical protein n=1 Tax=Rhodococcus sp. ACPA1 TaxID=2028572 RepID=UPI000BB14A85|nr:hypothetical protein [Rhodococcus sp. ACPA1]PBC54893.1 hypothetical protein CJ177_17945 [Rhodococcus sp. ACPA1]
MKKSDALPIPTERQPMTHAPRTADVDGDLAPNLDAGSMALSAFMKFHPFMGFFCWIAHAQFPSHHRPETRVSKLRADSKWFYWTCVTFDMVVTIIAVVGLLIVAGTVAYKSVIA